MRGLLLSAIALSLLSPARGLAVGVDAGPVLQAWDARYFGPRHFGSRPNAVAISPDSERVYVTGVGDYNGGGDFATLAW